MASKVSFERTALLFLIFIVAFGVRLYPLIHSPEMYRNGFGPYGDSFLYHKIAYNLYKGNGFSGTDDGSAFGEEVRLRNLTSKPLQGSMAPNFSHEPCLIRGPMYPLFMYCIYRFLGSEDDMRSIHTWYRNWDRVRFVQCILDAFTCLLVFYIVGFIVPNKIWPALLSSIVYCFSFYNMYYTRALLSETLASFLMTWFIFFCLLSMKKKRKIWWLIAGGMLALFIFTRPEYILSPLVFIVFILYFLWARKKEAITAVLIFLVGMAIVMSPWVVRNYIIAKRLIVVCEGQIGYSLFLGSFVTPQNWKGWLDFPQEVFENQQEKQDMEFLSYLHNFYMSQGSIQMKEIDDIFLNFTLRRFYKKPLEHCRLWFSKIPRLWSQNQVRLYVYKEASGNFFIFYFVFALSGFLTSKKEEKNLMTGQNSPSFQGRG